MEEVAGLGLGYAPPVEESLKLACIWMCSAPDLRRGRNRFKRIDEDPGPGTANQACNGESQRFQAVKSLCRPGIEWHSKAKETSGRC